MESILFEKQEASLCAQHALNMLLQGSYFSAVDLAEIARELDARESVVMGADSSRSYNMDDSGFFSIQVIAEALKVFNLELVPLTSPNAAQYRENPILGRAYICNLNEHWFAVRRFGFQWFTLNSLLSTPRLISDTYLSLFFAQLANDGYSIFLVDGELPACTADEVLLKCPVDPSLASRSEPIREDQQQDPDLARAIALSLSKEGEGGAEHSASIAQEDDELRKALETSRRLIDDDDHSLQQALRESMRDVPAGSELTEQEEEMDRQLQRALQMSLEQNLPDPCTVAGGSGLSGNTTKQLISRFEKSGEVEQCSDPKVSLSVKESSCEATSSSCFSGTKIVGGCIKNPKGLVDADESMDVKDEVGPDGAPKPTDSEESAFRSADSSEVRKQREQFLKRFDK